jgi:phage recombination protein Bet
MSDLVKTAQEGTALDLWKKKDKIRQMFAPNLTTDEFDAFVGLGASLGANPFNREIWAVKYGNQQAQIFLGRDFYRRKAQEQPDYNGHQVDVIYSNDKFKMVGGKPEHEYNLIDRGFIVGAYAVVYRSNNEPFFITVKFEEYSTGKSLWSTKPETMIKKVAEAQALRGAFQGLFAGTYDQSEEWEPEINPSNVEALPPSVEHLRDVFPSDKTLKAPKNDHRPYLTDGTEEFAFVESAVYNGVIEPNYLRYFYTITNTGLDYFRKVFVDREVDAMGVE